MVQGCTTQHPYTTGPHDPIIHYVILVIYDEDAKLRATKEDPE